MSKKKTKSAKAKTETAKDESFVVLFDDAEGGAAAAEAAADDGAPADAAEDKAAPAEAVADEADAAKADAGEVDAAEPEPAAKQDDGSFVVMLDAADESPDAGEAPKDDYFVVLLDEDEPEQQCVEQLEQGVFSVTLPADIRIQKIVAIKPALVATLGASVVRYDASRVALADTASIQVVAAHLEALAAADAKVEWLGTSDDFLDASRILGFDFTDTQSGVEAAA